MNDLAKLRALAEVKFPTGSQLVDSHSALLSLLTKLERGIKVLEEGLVYHEYDGHDMPKAVARDALDVLRGEKQGAWRKK